MDCIAVSKYSFRYTPWEFGLFYPGYWESFPLFNGAGAFTTESGGGGWKGLRLRLPAGHIITLKNGIIQNVIADYSVLRLTAKIRKQKLRDYLAYKRSVVEEGRRHSVQAYVFPPSNDPQRYQGDACTRVLYSQSGNPLFQRLSWLEILCGWKPFDTHGSASKKTPASPDGA